jgi:hypothetical protein
VKIGMTIPRAVDVPCNCSFGAGIDSIACLDPPGSGSGRLQR